MVVVVRVKGGLLFRLESDELAHSLVGSDPGSAGHRPPRTVLHLEGKSTLMAFVRNELHEIHPLPAQARNRIRHARPKRTVALSVKELNPRDSGGLDRVEIRDDPFLRSVPADDVKPGLRRGRKQPFVIVRVVPCDCTGGDDERY